MTTDTMNDTQRRDLAFLEHLKPYLAQCLGLNHEINNPLAGIIGYAEYMLDDEEPLSDDQRHYVQQIQNCAERIRSLIVALSERKSHLAEKFDLDSLLEEYRNEDNKSH